VTSYYVYYRVGAERLENVRSSVQEIFKTIESETGIRGRWLRRSDDPLTCMEVYENVRDEPAFEALLASEAASLGLERKIERFVAA